ncbi:MAG: hypothetical protein QM270_06680 [Bacillota bacterium]|nr:hypothetical protein [Bacillota bacterium]
MLSKQFIRLAREQNWRVDDDRISGDVDDLLFTILDSDHGITLILYLPSLLPATRDKLASYCLSNRKRLRLRDFEESDAFYFLRFRQGLFALSAERLISTIAILTALIREEQPLDPVCAVCQESCLPSERDYYLDLYCYAHAACIADGNASPEPEEADDDEA